MILLPSWSHQHVCGNLLLLVVVQDRKSCNSRDYHQLRTVKADKPLPTSKFVGGLVSGAFLGVRLEMLAVVFWQRLNPWVILVRVSERVSICLQRNRHL